MRARIECSCKFLSSSSRIQFYSFLPRGFAGRRQISVAATIAESQQRKNVGPSWPVLLNDFQTAKDVAQSGEFTIKALCDSIAYDRNFVTAKRSMDRHFMYTDATGSAHLMPDSTSIAVPTELLDVTPSELLTALETREASDPFWYFTSPLKQAAPRLAHLSQPWTDSMQIRPQSAESRVRGGMNIWMGTASSSTQAHYDTDDNVFVQAHGSKRFRLFSPLRAHELQLFPDAHPRARKSQLDFDKSSVPIADVDITLEPGDCLFIPAFWLHHVEALSASASVNVFSEAPAWTSAEQLLQLPTPSDRMSGPLAIESMCLFAAYALPRIGIADVSGFVVKHLLAARFHRVAGPSDAAAASVCLGAGGAAGALALARAPSEEFERCAAAFEEGVRALQAQDGGALALELVVAHLIELWAVRVGGPLQVKGILELLRDHA